MESIDISYWLATRDNKRSQNCSASTSQTLNHESFLRVVVQRCASKWRRLFFVGTAQSSILLSSLVGFSAGHVVNLVWSPKSVLFLSETRFAGK